ncbi:hypothetical protein KIPB_001225 [Kipferlia bialata]|uniref:Uncharacterized protein n=1 Tax=Kipferlia bialata TaxID=797122 RepID=A0A9K3GFR5_9EUKA|nr:hypothetical protein KIPB_001225 [Kipferlia bialata]|eukprot:g1225.t1
MPLYPKIPDGDPLWKEMCVTSRKKRQLEDIEHERVREELREKEAENAELCHTIRANNERGRAFRAQANHYYPLARELGVRLMGLGESIPKQLYDRILIDGPEMTEAMIGLYTPEGPVAEPSRKRAPVQDPPSRESTSLRRRSAGTERERERERPPRRSAREREREGSVSEGSDYYSEGESVPVMAGRRESLPLSVPRRPKATPRVLQDMSPPVPHTDTQHSPLRGETGRRWYNELEESSEYGDEVDFTISEPPVTDVSGLYTGEAEEAHGDQGMVGMDVDMGDMGPGLESDWEIDREREREGEEDEKSLSPPPSTLPSISGRVRRVAESAPSTSDLPDLASDTEEESYSSSGEEESDTEGEGGMSGDDTSESEGESEEESTGGGGATPHLLRALEHTGRQAPLADTPVRPCGREGSLAGVQKGRERGRERERERERDQETLTQSDPTGSMHATSGISKERYLLLSSQLVRLVREGTVPLTRPTSTEMLRRHIAARVITIDEKPFKQAELDAGLECLSTAGKVSRQGSTVTLHKSLLPPGSAPSSRGESATGREVGSGAGSRSGLGGQEGKGQSGPAPKRQGEGEGTKAQRERRLEAERLAAGTAEAEGLEVEGAEPKRLEAERAEAERLEAERRARRERRVEAERLAVEKAIAEQARAEKARAEQAKAEKARAERLEAEREREMPVHPDISEARFSQLRDCLSTLLIRRSVTNDEAWPVSTLHRLLSREAVAQGSTPYSQAEFDAAILRLCDDEREDEHMAFREEGDENVYFV